MEWPAHLPLVRGGGVSHDPQMPFQIPYQLQEGFQTSMWVNPEFPIHGEVVGRSQHIYA